MAEDITPEQEKLQKEIQKKVDLLKFYRTHIRWAGIIVTALGALAHVTGLMAFGVLIYVFSFTGSIITMEEINLLIWDKSDEQKNEEENEG